MDLSVTKLNFQPSFCGRKKIFTDKYIEETMIPYIKADIPIKKLLEEQKVSIRVLDDWAKEKYGMPFRKLYFTEINNTLASRLRNAQASGATLDEIAKQEGHSVSWVLKRFKNFDIMKQYDERQKLFEEFVPQMIKMGYPLERMAKELRAKSKAIKVSISIISKWINQKYDKTLVELRGENKVFINKDNSNYKYLKSILTNIFEKGHTITEASEITGISKPMISHWVERFGIETKAQKAKKKLDEILALRMAQGYSLDEIAKETGLTSSTVAKKAKQRFKKTFKKAQKYLMETFFDKH